MSTNKSRAYIINTLYDDFDGLVSDEVIESSLIKLGIISSVSKQWLKEHFIDKQLSAKECSEIIGCSLGHIQGCIKKYKLTKKNFGITTGNNEAHRRMLWKRKIQNAQPNRKEVVVFDADGDTPLFECPSIEATARKTGINREHIRDCLNPNKQRNTAKGLRFVLKKEYVEKELAKDIKMCLDNRIINSGSSIEDLISATKTAS